MLYLSPFPSAVSTSTLSLNCPFIYHNLAFFSSRLSTATLKPPITSSAFFFAIPNITSISLYLSVHLSSFFLISSSFSSIFASNSCSFTPNFSSKVFSNYIFISYTYSDFLFTSSFIFCNSPSWFIDSTSLSDSNERCCSYSRYKNNFYS